MPDHIAALLDRLAATKIGVAILNPDVEAWSKAACLERRSLPCRMIEKDLFDGRWLRITETTLNDGWGLNVLCDISDLKPHEMTLREARDAAVGQANATPEPLSVSVLDLHHVKRINDGLMPGLIGCSIGPRRRVETGSLVDASDPHPPIR